MFSITPKTCHASTLAEIFIMAAMNVETSRPASRTCIRANTAVAQRG